FILREWHGLRVWRATITFSRTRMIGPVISRANHSFDREVSLFRIVNPPRRSRGSHTFAGAWTNENRPTMTPVCTRSAPTDCAYRGMIGTSAFESIVPNIVAARTFAVIRRGIGRGT